MQEIIAGLGSSVPVIYYTKASHHLLPSIVKVARCIGAWTGVYRSLWYETRGSERGDPGESGSGDSVFVA